MLKPYKSIFSENIEPEFITGGTMQGPDTQRFIKMSGVPLHKFDKKDYMGYQGIDKLSDGTEPLIGSTMVQFPYGNIESDVIVGGSEDGDIVAIIATSHTTHEHFEYAVDDLSILPKLKPYMKIEELHTLGFEQVV